MAFTRSRVPSSTPDVYSIPGVYHQDGPPSSWGWYNVISPENTLLGQVAIRKKDQLILFTWPPPATLLSRWRRLPFMKFLCHAESQEWEVEGCPFPEWFSTPTSPTPPSPPPESSP